MPIYEYHCDACHKLHEELQDIDDPPLSRCPSCGSDLFHKRVSVAAFKLTGTGWYETDFKGKKGSTSSSETSE